MNQSGGGSAGDPYSLMRGCIAQLRATFGDVMGLLESEIDRLERISHHHEQLGLPAAWGHSAAAQAVPMSPPPPPGSPPPRVLIARESQARDSPSQPPPASSPPSSAPPVNPWTMPAGSPIPVVEDGRQQPTYHPPSAVRTSGGSTEVWPTPNVRQSSTEQLVAAELQRPAEVPAQQQEEDAAGSRRWAHLEPLNARQVVSEPGTASPSPPSHSIPAGAPPPRLPSPGPATDARGTSMQQGTLPVPARVVGGSTTRPLQLEAAVASSPAPSVTSTFGNSAAPLAVATPQAGRTDFSARLAGASASRPEPKFGNRVVSFDRPAESQPNNQQFSFNMTPNVSASVAPPAEQRSTIPRLNYGGSTPSSNTHAPAAPSPGPVSWAPSATAQVTSASPQAKFPVPEQPMLTAGTAAVADQPPSFTGIKLSAANNALSNAAAPLDASPPAAAPLAAAATQAAPSGKDDLVSAEVARLLRDGVWVARRDEDGGTYFYNPERRRSTYNLHGEVKARLELFR